MIEVRFTTDEFETMVQELLYCDPVSFDTLCQIADKTLRPSVINWCKAEDCLRGRGYEDDIMQEIHLRLMKTTVDYFLLRDGIDGPYNNNPEGFEDWMFRVADNLKRDFANKVRNRDFKTEDIDDPNVISTPDDGDYDAEERIDRLKEAFSIVISADVNIYKVLTWLAQFIFILDANVTKIKSNELIIVAFENKTLFEMYDMILTASKRIPWIVISKTQNDRILEALRKKRSGDVSYGETKYKEFFMKHNGEVSGKKSISDWVNRMNDMIKKKTDPQADTSKKGNKNKKPEQSDGKKRRGGDETSNC